MEPADAVEAALNFDEAAPILLVDDQPANLQALELTLASTGCRFVQARSADEALLALLEQEFAAIVLDIQMPQMNGLELAELVRKRQRTRYVPILFLTAHMVDEQDMLLGYRAGGVDYLTKPISPEILRAKVVVFVDLWRKTQALARANAALQREVLERMKVEEALKSVNQELEQRVEVRTGALKEADKRKDDFLAALAHELRNPLAAMRNAAEVIRLKAGGDNALASPMGVMQRQLKQMTRLIDDLLDVSRITRDKLQLHRERVSLSLVINAALETSRPIIEQRQHQLTLQLPHRPVFVDGDQVRLAQVFANLLDNAAKYSEPGGRIRLNADVVGPEVVVRVEDSGIGIEHGALPSVFEPFMQVGKTGLAQSGLGIGLTLVKRLVEMHGGTVSGLSEGKGKGSQFVVRLPLARGTAEVAEAAPAPSSAPLPRHRVMIVEDNRDAAKMLQSLVEQWGQDVRVAHDAFEALKQAPGFKPDIVLLDIGLPQMHGYELARQLRDKVDGHRMLLVAITGWGQEADRQQSKAAGIDYHLLKPVDPEKLHALLGEVGGQA
jgi:signal transduction histidine kinase/BarA-like signal transduction histidine kinase